MRKLQLLAAAEQELQNAAQHYENARAGLGVEFLQELEKLFERIAVNAHAFPKWRDDLPFRKAVLLRKFPFIVFFTEDPETVRVIAVAHGRRPPGYWLRRAKRLK